MLTTAAATDKAHVRESGDTGQHERDAATQLSAVVLVISRRHDHLGPVANISAQRHHPEHARQGLVGPPVCRQSCAGEVGTVRSNEAVGDSIS